jgi:hypothetical protein
VAEKLTKNEERLQELMLDRFIRSHPSLSDTDVEAAQQIGPPWIPFDTNEQVQQFDDDSHQMALKGIQRALKKALTDRGFIRNGNTDFLMDNLDIDPRSRIDRSEFYHEGVKRRQEGRKEERGA